MNTTAVTELVNLTEISPGDAGLASRVDLASGVIRGVKVLGFQSGNTGRSLGLSRDEFGDAIDQPYSYARQAVQEAIHLYEGVGVYIDHPEQRRDIADGRAAAPKERKTIDRFGRLSHVTVREEGLYADLEFLRNHPVAAMVVEAARRMPESLAMSHNAVGRPKLEDGRITIDSIVEVRSVDIVGDRAGTTKGLFETLRDDSQPTTAADTEKSPTSATTENAVDPAVENTIEPATAAEDSAEELWRCLTLLEQRRIAVSKPLLEALAAIPSVKHREALLDAWPQEAASSYAAAAPRSQSRQEVVARGEADLSTPAKVIAALRGA